MSTYVRGRLASTTKVQDTGYGAEARGAAALHAPVPGQCGAAQVVQPGPGHAWDPWGLHALALTTAVRRPGIGHLVLARVPSASLSVATVHTWAGEHFTG